MEPGFHTIARDVINRESTISAAVFCGIEQMSHLPLQSAQTISIFRSHTPGIKSEKIQRKDQIVNVDSTTEA